MKSTNRRNGPRENLATRVMRVLNKEATPNISCILVFAKLMPLCVESFCDKGLTDLSARLISIFRARPWGRPLRLSHLVDEMMQTVITEKNIDKP